MSAIPDSRRKAEHKLATRKTLAAAIAEHPFLKDVSPDHLPVLADNAMRVQFEPGAFIFRERDPANRFYLIESGQVALESRSGDEPALLIQTIGPGDVLGWSWLFPPYYWHFDARAIESTAAIFFYGTRLREQCEEDHDLGYELMTRVTSVVIQRLQAARKQLFEIRH
ncbi:MAG: Crp/Fnr family transcriptional regulator [Verrucomicrobia bacterium]|nr:Crp/Fnr family transcriptional regulator [Verrucomicrobiota bacterium]